MQRFDCVCVSFILRVNFDVDVCGLLMEFVLFTVQKLYYCIRSRCFRSRCFGVFVSNEQAVFNCKAVCNINKNNFWVN